MTKIYKLTELPPDTLITQDMASIDYADSYMIKKKTDESIKNIAKKILTLPHWIVFMLRIRYYLIVKPFGLDTGRFDNVKKDVEAESDPVPVLYSNENEIVMGSNDKHLYYRISVMKKETDTVLSEIYLNTVVKFNNIWGRVYFLPVRIGHKLVVRSLLKRI